MTFSLASPTAFYAFNLVANWVYTRWDAMYPDLLAQILSREAAYREALQDMDGEALQLVAQGVSMDKVVEALTRFSESLGQQLLADWVAVFEQLFVKYRDGFVTTAKAKALAPVCGCDTSSLPYADQWYNRIVEDTGDLYLVPRSGHAEGSDSMTKKKEWATIDKLQLRSFN
jgi:hypothetical protein